MHFEDLGLISISILMVQLIGFVERAKYYGVWKLSEVSILKTYIEFTLIFI